MSEYIEIEALTVHYDCLAALIDVSVNIPKGRMTAIIGPNGAGKSTLIKACFEMVDKASGNVKFFGKSFQDFKSEIAYISQIKDVDWNFPITVSETVMMGAFGRKKLFSSYSEKDKQKSLELLKKFGLFEKKDQLISALSGGERQRLFIARAYMQEASVYVFDEPMAFVDAVTSKVILDSMIDLKKSGKTVICVHHDLEEVKEHFDYAVLLAHYIVDSGPVQQVLTKKHIQQAYNAKETMLTEAFSLSKEKEAGRV